MSELHSVNEGLEFVNEAGRLKGFFDKVIAFFKMAINKLAEITKAFITKIDQFIRSNDSFVKKYDKQIRNANESVIASIEFKGYRNFSDELNNTPAYNTSETIDMAATKAMSIANNPENHSEFKAKQSLFKGTNHTYKSDSDDFSEAVTKYLFGSDEKEEFKLNKAMVTKALEDIKATKNLKKKAKDSYTSAAKQIKNIIKKLENAAKDVDKNYTDEKLGNNPTLKDKNAARAKIEKGYKILIDYWKAYSQGCQTYHGTFMRALSARNHQSKAMCVKVVQKLVKGKGQEERNNIRRKAKMDEKDYSESYISTDAFLGAVEFI